MSESYNPYLLPTINFVGGETQDLVFNVYFYEGKKAFSLTGCTADFSIVSYMNKNGAPVLTKSMKATYNNAGTSDNLLTVTLLPMDTINLTGKYIYQISIRDVDGNVEIPSQGILYVTNNINKSFITQ